MMVSQRTSMWDSIETWARGGRNARWPGGMQDKLTTRTPPLLHPLHKNAPTVDYFLSSNSLLPYRCKTTITLVQLIEVWPLYDLPGVAIVNSSPPCPTAQAEHVYQADNGISKASQPFSTRPLCPHLVKAAKQSQPQSPFGGPSLPLCCLPSALA